MRPFRLGKEHTSDAPAPETTIPSPEPPAPVPLRSAPDPGKPAAATPPKVATASRSLPLRMAAFAAWATPTRMIVGAAAVPSVLSLIWTATSVADMITIGGPVVALAVGVVLDVALVGGVLIAWVAPEIRRTASNASWVLAAIAAAAIGFHHWGQEAVIFAVVPLISKLLWHLALAARTAWEQHRDATARTAAEQEAEKHRQAEQAVRDAEQAAAAEAERERERTEALSLELTEAEEVEHAELRRKARRIRARAEAEREVIQAEAEADRIRQEATSEAERIRQETEHRMRQDAIRRRVEEEMAVQQADADLLKQRFALERELRLIRPYELTGNEPASRVPDDASALTPPPGGPTAGFGGFGNRGGHPSAGEAERNRRLVADARAALLAEDREVTIGALARHTGLSERTVGRHLKALTDPS
ncbi:hypothetical protein [Nocardiopsis sp. CC223A]|uniref:hypothetical protein n=1 Tax=Nocardiopsis sp. CC223A TaxID=3044051 RepID=UPI00278C0F7A|nr:hypothetical protein [Nocardiopsis sp. CC223A]